MNLSDLTITDKEPKSKKNLERIPNEESSLTEELRKEYEARVSEMSSYFLSEKDWCESHGIKYISFWVSRDESVVEISRNFAIKLLKEVDKYKIFYEEN